MSFPPSMTHWVAPLTNNAKHSSSLCARRLLLLSVVRPSVEYGSAVCDCNKNQASALYLAGLKGFFRVHLKHLTRQLEGIWVLIH